jgi:hypothetical protein
MYVLGTSYVVNIPRGAKQVMGLLGGVLASLGKWPALKHYSRIQCERIGFDDDNKHKQAQKASGSFGPRSRFEFHPGSSHTDITPQETGMSIWSGPVIGLIRFDLVIYQGKT